MGQWILKYGEDRKSSGLLGAIGFGEKSPHPLEFRLICRLLGTFLLYQVKEQCIRVDPYDPFLKDKVISRHLYHLHFGRLPTSC